MRPADGEPYLTDKIKEMIVTPTVHILRAKDPGRRGGVALFNLCTNGTASLYEHGQGHEIPKAPAIIKKMAEQIREMVAHVAKNCQPET